MRVRPVDLVAGIGGDPSALRRYGLGDALVAGDYLFCRAFALCARFEADVIRWCAEACVALTEGEILQSRFRRNPAVTADDYFEIVHRKTAVLFSTGARTAAHLAGASAELIEAMDACGHHLGVAFQMQDDLLDVVGDAGVTGKPHGLDLRDGNPSLPIVLALGRDDGLVERFARAQPTPQEVEDGLRRIRASGALATVRDMIRAEAEAGLALLHRLPPSAPRSALIAIVDTLGDRVR